MTEPLDGESWLAELRQRIPEIDPAVALQRQTQGALLIDVREEHERAAGLPVAALPLSRGHLELQIEANEPRREREILLLCASGRRSLLAAEALQRMGYRNVVSVAGGFKRWQAENLPIAAGAIDADTAERYARQLQLQQVGKAGQQKLTDARIALLGAGGLGAPAALYLAAAGIGRLTLIDDDRVERSNLHRQVIHADARVGMAKTESARMSLLALNPRIDVVLRNERLRADNAERLLQDHDLVIDGADNFPARYLISAATRRLGIPMVYGAVERFSGHVSVFDPRRSASPCYRCLFPEPPAAVEAPNCSEAGVLGVLPGMVGLLQATEALKLVLGLGDSLVGRLLSFDALTMRFRETRLPRDPECPGCGAHAVFSGYQDIERFCSIG